MRNFVIILIVNETSSACVFYNIGEIGYKPLKRHNINAVCTTTLTIFFSSAMQSKLISFLCCSI
jgi:hypothetical protein